MQGMTLEAHLLPGLERFPSVGGARDAGLIAKLLGSEKSDEVAARRFDQRRFIE
jgi:hypothetical protein